MIVRYRDQADSSDLFLTKSPSMEDLSTCLAQAFDLWDGLADS